MYGLSVIGLVVGSLLENGGYSFCHNRQTLIFRRQILVRCSFGLMAALIALVPTLTLRSFVMGLWPHFWCYSFAMVIGFLAGAMEARLFVENAAYESAMGFPLFPFIRRGRFQDFAGIGLTNTRNAYLVTIEITTPKERLLILGSFDKRDKAAAFVQQIADTTGIPILPNSLPVEIRQD